MREQIESLIKTYKGNIKSGGYCSCRAACNCDENLKYTNTVYKKVIDDLEKIVNPPACMICNGANGLTKFVGDKLFGYICIDCIDSPTQRKTLHVK